jgi:signal transduction histidine kinase
MRQAITKARCASLLTYDHHTRRLEYTLRHARWSMVTSTGLEQSGYLQMLRISSRLLRAATRAGLAVLLFAGSSEAAVRHVLLLQSVERGNLTIDFFTGNFRVDVSQRAGDSVTFTEFVVNPAGFDETPEQAIVYFLQSAFANRPKPDLVMTVGGPAAAFAREYGHQIFPESPILFAAVDQRFLAGAALGQGETTVAVRNDFPAVVDAILQLFPRTSTVFMVTGSGPLGRFWRQQLEDEFQRFGNRVRFIWSDESSLAEILRRVSRLPPDSAIFFMSFTTDALGGAYPEDRVLDEIHAVANAPLFGGQGAMLGHGIVGGPLMSIDDLGQVAADVASRMLKGESPASITTPVLKPGLPVFDSRELRRWDVSESRLPPGSLVRFREPGVWNRFKWVIIAAASVLMAQALLIGALLVNRAKRRLAEQLLRQNVANLNVARGALSNLSGRLMHAQEQERARVARELHDDVSQRMTFVAMDLVRLRQTLSESETDAQGQAQSLYDAVIELARDVQGISHRMHSSKIDLLGIAAAAGNLCKEVSSHQDLQIRYVQENVPTRLPEGVAISVYRVLQEALSNAVKHSGARHCKVTLQGLTDALTLEVIDDGRGFDAAAMWRAHGLGLIGMQERLKLVDGDVVIESKVGAGTAVHASVPLRPDPVMDAHAVSPSAD